MHDLVRDFVLISSSKVKQASNQLRREESYDRILLNCKGLLEFPENFNHPNLTLLKLMYGDEQLKFPEDFYARMKKLEVLAYNNMRQPKLPQSLTNLRALCLSSCWLVDVDISFLGDLINLEILTLVGCGIRKLPSKIGNLKKLKLLDLSGCDAICIDDGVFQNLGKLEELYMRGRGIRFMDANCKPLKMLKRFALEFQFFENKVRPVDVSFDKIERFRISVGCELEYFFSLMPNLLFRNTLKLNTSIDELLEGKVNELFKNTEILHLVVNDMHHLERIVAPPLKYSFCMLKELCVSHCTSLTCLFTVSMVEGLTELEILDVASCPVLKSLVNGGDSEAGVITFHKLKKLIMKDLPELESLCDLVYVMKLPQLIELQLDALTKFTSIFSGDNNNISAKQTLLKNEAMIPNLEVLSVRNMKNLKEIWACEITSIEEEANNTFMLKILKVFTCDSLEGLLTVSIAKRLRKLEILEVGSCPVLKSIVSGENNTEDCLRKLESLEYMDLHDLPQLVSLSDCVNTMELPMLRELGVSQLSNIVSIFPEIVTPKLEMLTITNMENLQEIWPREITSSEEGEVNIGSMLREIGVSDCDSLVNLFPSNPMRLLCNLEELKVQTCGSLEVLFNIDLGKNEQLCLNNSLKTIYVRSCESFKEVCRIRDGESNYSSLFTSGFQSVEDLEIIKCKRFTKIMVNSDLRATKNVHVYGESLNEMVLKNNQEQEITMSGEESPSDNDQQQNCSSYHITPSFNRLRRIESPSDKDQQQPLLIFHKTSFQNLRFVRVDSCNSIKYLFSPLMVTLFSNLTKVQISHCHGMEQVVSNIDDEDAEITFAHTTTGLFPSLQILQLSYMSSLKQIGGSVGKDSANAACHGQSKVSPKGVVSWSLCQYTKEITISSCGALSSVVPSYAAGRTQNLQVLSITFCSKMTEVFQTEEIHNNNNISTTLTIPRVTNNIVHQFPNLKELEIDACHSLKYVFTFSMLESLEKLETLTVKNCTRMKAIVKKKEEDCDAKVSEIKFPCLKSLKLVDLSSLEGFCLRKEEFTFESLYTLAIDECPIITVFTKGRSVTPKLTSIETSFGSFDVNAGEDINTFIMEKKQEGHSFGEVWYSSEHDEPSSEDD